MLEFDQSLFPLTAAEQEQAFQKALSAARRGTVPPISPSAYGRVVVVNPYEGFTTHHVPDDLRKPLRRAMVSGYLNSQPQTGPQLVEQILEASAEPIYVVVVELHSDFPHIFSLFENLPTVRKAHPAMQVILHATPERVTALLRDWLQRRGAACQLMFETLDEPVLLSSPDQLQGIMEEAPVYPVFPRPFFSHLRITMGRFSPIFTLKTLPKLYADFGVGHVNEMGLTGRRREKEMAVEIPMHLIEAIRFSPNRGEAFHAVKVDGEKILSADFAKRDLEGPLVPVSILEGVFRRLPGKGEDRIPIKDVRAVRINLHDGQTAFLWKPGPTYIPMQEVDGLRLLPPGAQSKGVGDADDARPDGDEDGARPDGEEDDARPAPIEIHSTVVTPAGKPDFGAVRAAVRERFLQQMFVGSFEKRIKLEHYANRLNIGCVGAMAAQALKLLRGRGLEQYIPNESIYYLCDSAEQLPEYHLAGERAEALYTGLLTELIDIFGEGRSGTLHHELISHRLPLLHEWVRGEAPDWKQLSAEHLETVFKELKVFLGFAEIEFQRVEGGRAAQENYLEKMGRCEELSLQANHLGNLVGERYGRLPTRETPPDFVVFGTPADTASNRSVFYLPSMPFTRLIGTDAAKKLFQENDFEFTVFLEEQLAIAAYLKSQEFGPDADDGFHDRYFQEQISDLERELGELKATLDVRVEPESPRYDFTYKRMETTHADEMDGFRQDRAREAGKLEERENDYFEALKAVDAYLEEDGGGGEELLSGEDYIGALDARLMQRSKQMLDELKGAVKHGLGDANGFLKEKREGLTSFLLNFSRLQKAAFAQVQQEYQWRVATQFRAAVPAIVDRLNAIGRVAPKELDGVERNLRKRHKVAAGEVANLQEALNKKLAENQRAMGAVKESNRRLTVALSQSPAGKNGDASPVEIIASIEEKFRLAKEEMGRIIQATAKSNEIVDAMRALNHERGDAAITKAGCDNDLALVDQLKSASRLQRIVTNKITDPLVAPPRPEGLRDPEEGAAQLERDLAEWRTQGEALTDFKQRHESMGEMRERVDAFFRFDEVYGNFRRAVRAKLLGQKAMEVINGRIIQLEKERANLPRFIEETMLPAQETMTARVRIPRIQKRIGYFARARLLMNDLQEVSMAGFQKAFLNYAVHKRFHKAQFFRGAHFGMNPDLPLFSKLGNLLPGLYEFHRLLKANLAQPPVSVTDVSLIKLPTQRPAGIRQYIEEQQKLPPDARFTYLVLPGSLSLSQALELVAFKEDLFNGLPQLMLIYLSKFDTAQLRGDPELSERYLTAIKHNIVANIDDLRIIDNPRAIAEAMIKETLGCCRDVEKIDWEQESGGVDSLLHAGTA